MARTPKPWYREERDDWCVVLDGKRHTLAKGRRSRKAAEAAFHELMVQRAAAPGPLSERPTVAGIVDAYLVHARRHLEPRSFDERKRLLQRFVDARGELVVAECRPFHLSGWIDDNPAWKSAWTLNTVASVVKRPFDWAAAEGLVPLNPFKSVSRAAGLPRRPVTDDEFQRLLRGAPGRRGRDFRQALVFMWWTGCRPKELSRLRWGDLRLDDGRIVIAEHKTGKKTRRERIIYLTTPVVKLLIYRRKESAAEFVFTNSRGNPWNRCSLSLRLQRCRARQGLAMEAKLYGIRHRFGTTAIVNGVDLKTLAELMGHSTTRMTEHYVHLARESGHLSAAMHRASARRPVPGAPTAPSAPPAAAPSARSPRPRGKRPGPRGRSGTPP